MTGAGTGDGAAREALRVELNSSLVLEAAAGTGKTRELVARAVALLASGIARVDRLAMITFTERAAGELKLRLREALDRARAEAERAERERIEGAIARLEEASIDTIHGFCREILATRPIEAGIDPDFVVEGDGERLIRRVFRPWFAEQLSRPPPGLARYLARGRVTQPDETPVSRLEGAVHALLQQRDLDAPWERPDEDLNAEATSLIRALGDLRALLARGDPDDPLRLAFALVSDLSETLEDAERRGPEAAGDREAHLVELGQRLAASLSAGNFGTGPFAEGLPRPRLIHAARKLEVKLRGFREMANQDLAAVLREELRPVVERYARLTRRMGRLDFQDLLILTRDLVRDQPAARRALQDRFRHILVDEFQDTDPLQAEILLLLCAEDPEERSYLSARPGPGRLTLVGDPKQSIYGFRRADLRLYTAVTNRLTEHGARRLHLTESHRSLAPIQGLVNTAFRPVFSSRRRTEQPDYVPLEGGPPAIEGQPAIVALPAPRPLGDRGTVFIREVRRSLPRALAGFIAWLVRDSGWSVRGAHGLRAVEASDVCLLYRGLRGASRDQVVELQRHLEAFGIDTVLVGAGALHDRDEVETLLTALTALEWPEDELAVYGTLRGPFFSFTDDELYAYRLRHASLHPYRAPPAQEELTNADAAILEALGLLRELSRERNRRPFADTVQAFLQITRAPVGLGLRPGGAQALANVDRVLDLARRFEASEGLSFRGFVEHLREASEYPQSSEGAVNEETAPGARIMTAHKAKGLEFPVVVLADPTSPRWDNPSQWTDASARLFATALAGLVPKPLATHREAAVEREHAESDRLAYVAATRARDLLVLATVGLDSSRIAGRGQSWLSPLLSAIQPRREDERSPEPCPGAPAFGEHTLLASEGATVRSVKPGLHRGRRTSNPEDAGPEELWQASFQVAWWDPSVLPVPPPPTHGLAHEAFLAPGERSAEIAAAHEDWQAQGDAVRNVAQEQSILLLDARVRSGSGAPTWAVAQRSLSGAELRPRSRRYALLVHRAFADLELDAGADAVAPLVRLHARTLKAPAEEEQAAIESLRALCEDELLGRARGARSADKSFPNVDIRRDGSILEATADLLFEEEDGWVVVDIVTAGGDVDGLRTKMEHVLEALARGGRTVRSGVVLRV